MTKKQQIFDILDKQGYILDNQTIEILGIEGLCNVGEYIRMWKALKKDTEFFKDKKIVEKVKAYRKHLIRAEGSEQNQYYPCSKEFFKTITI